jgi:PAS domain S-box-containing protein
MTRPRLASVRARLLLIVLLAVLPALAFIAYDAKEEYRRETTAALAQAVLLAQLVSSQHDDLLAGARHLLVALAQLPQVRAGDRVACSRLFADLLRQYTRYTNLGATTLDGEVFCSAVATRGAVTVADRPWFQQAVRSRDFTIGEYQIGRFTGKPALVFGYPVLGGGGQMLGAAFAGLDLAWLNQVVRRTHLPGGTVVTVMDRTGTVLARYPDPERWVGQPAPEPTIVPAVVSGREGTAEGPGSDGVDRLFAFTPLGRERESGAYVSVAIPKAHAFARVRQELFRDVLGLILTTAAMLVLAWVGGSALLLRPVKALVGATRRLRDGELTARTGLTRDAGEFGLLGQAFDDMADALERRARERESAEAALRESEAQYRSLVESSSDAILLTVPDGQILAANAAACQLFGTTEREIFQAGRSGLVDATDPRLAASLEERDGTGRATGELRLRRKDGTTFEGEVSSTVFPDRNGEPRTSMIIRDITARKRMEEELRSSERRLRETVETLKLRTGQLEALRATAADITRELDLATLLRLVAERACELAGATAADIDLWDPERQVLVPGASYGHARPRPTTTRRLGEGAMGTVAQQRQGMIINDYRASPLAHPDTLAHTTITASLVEPLLYHDRLLGVIGVDHETPGRTFTEHDQATLRLFATQAAIAIENARLFREAHDRRAQLEALRATTADIIRELDSSKLLTLFIERAVTLLQGVSGVVYLLDPATGIITPKAWVGHGDWVSGIRLQLGEGVAGTVIQGRRGIIENAYRTSSYAVPLFLERTAHTAVLSEPLVYHDRVIGSVLVDRRDSSFTERDRDLLRLFADQAAIAIENARLFRNQQQAYLELQQAQDELVRSEKLRGLGQMAAGIAHDLNNMLATILGQTELLRLRVRHPEIQEGLQTIQTAANDGAEVVRRLQDFARQRGGGPLSPCDLTLLVPEVLDITRPRWREEPRRKGIVIEAAVDIAELPPIQGNPAEIRQVLTNLIFNAVDAMPSGGRLHFTGRCDSQGWSPGVPSFSGAPPVSPPPQWVELSVADTGIPAWASPSCTASWSGTAARSMSRPPPARGRRSASDSGPPPLSPHSPQHGRRRPWLLPVESCSWTMTPRSGGHWPPFFVPAARRSSRPTVGRRLSLASRRLRWTSCSRTWACPR